MTHFSGLGRIASDVSNAEKIADMSDAIPSPATARPFSADIDAFVTEANQGNSSAMVWQRFGVDVMEAERIADQLWIPPAPGTVWATLTPGSPSVTGKAFLTLDFVRYYSMDGASMFDNGQDCVTAYLTPQFDGRYLQIDFTVQVQRTTSDPTALAKCQLCSDLACRRVDFASDDWQTEIVSVLMRTKSGYTHQGRVWHEGPFSMKFKQCKVTAV